MASTRRGAARSIRNRIPGMLKVVLNTIQNSLDKTCCFFSFFNFRDSYHEHFTDFPIQDPTHDEIWYFQKRAENIGSSDSYFENTNISS